MSSRSFMMLLNVAQVVAHGTVVSPAFRPNPTSHGGWCPYCQGSKEICEDWTKACSPPTPCWGSTPDEVVDPRYFHEFKDTTKSDGTPWIVQHPKPLPQWCPGSTIDISYFIKADHNGVYRWDAQRVDAGMNETEAGFHNITGWRSANHDPNTQYYHTDGKTPIAPDMCTKENGTVPWAPNVPECRNEMWAQTTLKLPASLPAGRTVMRWFWYGGMQTDGTRVKGPENALFLSCVDVMIGDAAQCAGRS